MIPAGRGAGQAMTLCWRSARGDSTIITRRELLAVSGAGALAAALNAVLPAAPLGAADLLTPYIKLAGSLDERLIIWWLKGQRYGTVAAQATPLFGWEVGRFYQFFRQANGSFLLAMFQLGYYTDTNTGRLLERFPNPITGVVNDVTHLVRRPAICQYTAAGRFIPALNDSVVRYRSQVSPVSVKGDTVQIASSINAEMLSPFPGTPNRCINDHITVTGLRSDLLDPGTPSAPAALSYRNVEPWEPWMKMGNQSGQMTSWATGRKLESLAEMPTSYLEMARAVHPWLIRDPIETLAVQVQKIRNSLAG